MNKYQMIASIVATVVPSIVTIVTLCITVFRDFFSTRRNSIKERVEKLYLVFYKECIAMEFPRCHFSQLSVEAQKATEKRLFSEIHLAGTKSQALYIEFSRVWTRSISKDHDVDAEKVDEAFNTLASSLMKEYNRLCRKIRLPKPPKLS